MAVWRDDHFDKSGRGPVFSEQAAEDRLEMIADFHRSELFYAVLPYLIRFTDGDVVGGHKPTPKHDTEFSRLEMRQSDCRWL